MLTDDVEAIRGLLHAYAELLDGGDLDGVAALFAHSTWGAPARPEVLRGSEEVRRGYDGVILYEDGTPRTKHVITNVTVEVDGDRATAGARSYFTVLQAVPGFPLQPIIAGRYRDRFERVDDAWRFADRQIVTDLVGDLSRHMKPGSGAPERT